MLLFHILYTEETVERNLYSSFDTEDLKKSDELENIISKKKKKI